MGRQRHNATAPCTEEDLDAPRPYRTRVNGMSSSDPLMLEFRVSDHDKRLERHETILQATRDAVVEQRQANALLVQEVRGLRRDLEDEMKSRNDRDKAWEARVRRLTIAWFSVAGSLVAGALVLALTVAGAQ